MSYAVTTGKKMSWVSSIPQDTKPRKTRKGKAEPVVLYPIFVECSELTDDIYWKNVFSSASLGKFPRNFTFKNGQLIHKKGTKEHKIEVGDEVVSALMNCLDFFRKLGGLKSDADRENDRLELEQYIMEQQDPMSMTWADIRAKKRKKLVDTHISCFIASVAEEMQLDRAQADQLATTINLGFMLGVLTDDHVEFHGRIKRINGLSYSVTEDKFILNDPIPNQMGKLHLVPDSVVLGYAPPSKRVTKSSKNSDSSFIDSWSKFVSSLNGSSKPRKSDP